MTNRTSLLAAVLVACLLAGCASGFSEFYRPAEGATPEAVAKYRLSAPPQTPRLETGGFSDPQATLDYFAKLGYLPIGQSFFSAGSSESESAALEQGRKVGADLVYVVNPKHAGSTTAAIPITTPTTSTTYSSASAIAYGRGGPVTAFGTGTSTTYSSTTSLVPITIHRFEYGAIFFVKQRFGLGALFRDLSDAERQSLQTNRGAIVRLIVNETPAFNADLLVGDLVKSIDAVPVTNANAIGSLLRERRGKTVVLSISRNGKPLEKTIALNP